MRGDQFDNAAYDASEVSARMERDEALASAREEDYGEDAPSAAELADDRFSGTAAPHGVSSSQAAGGRQRV